MSWSEGQGAKSPVSQMEVVDPQVVDALSMYKILIGTIVPRPIAFISTISKGGIVNLAPFSFFNGVASNPPSLMVSIARKPDGTMKDTLRNIKETGQFVVNSSSTWLVDPLVFSAANFGPDESEFDLSGLTKIDSIRVKPPRVKESAVHFECELLHAVEVGDGSAGSSTVVIGKIVLAHIMKEAINEKLHIDPEVLQPLGRLGGTTYSTLGQVFSKKVPEVEEVLKSRSPK